MDKKYDEKQDSINCFWKWVEIPRYDGQLYIKRLIIIRLPWFAIMLHKIYLSDTDCQHSHPWNFISILLSGWYREWIPSSSSKTGQEGKVFKKGSILYRPADWVHRLEVNERQDGKPAVTTLVFTGSQIRNWGFHTPKGFVPWKQYKSTGSCN